MHDIRIRVRIEPLGARPLLTSRARREPIGPADIRAAGKRHQRKRNGNSGNAWQGGSPLKRQAFQWGAECAETGSQAGDCTRIGHFLESRVLLAAGTFLASLKCTACAFAPGIRPAKRVSCGEAMLASATMRR
jgi:hypothetical protein